MAKLLPAKQEQKELSVPLHQASELTLAEGLAHVERIQAIMRQHFREGFHFGTVPGTQTPTLYRRGAEFLCRQLRLRASFQTRRREREGGHFVWEAKCILINKKTREIEGEGIGHCGSMEVKYRYREGPGGGKERIAMASSTVSLRLILQPGRRRQRGPPCSLTKIVRQFFGAGGNPMATKIDNEERIGRLRRLIEREPAAYGPLKALYRRLSRMAKLKPMSQTKGAKT